MTFTSKDDIINSKNKPFEEVEKYIDWLLAISIATLGFLAVYLKDIHFCSTLFNLIKIFTLLSAIISVGILGYTRHKIYSIKIETSLIYSKLDFAENRFDKLDKGKNEEKELSLKKEIEHLTTDYAKEFNKIELLAPVINNIQYILIIELILASCAILIINF